MRLWDTKFAFWLDIAVIALLVIGIALGGPFDRPLP